MSAAEHDVSGDTLDPADVADALREAMSEFADGAIVRAAVAGAATREAIWRRLADLGWLGLTAPSAWGGLGQGAPQSAALYEELGAVLSPAPYLPTMLFAEALLVRSCPAALSQDLLPRIVNGSLKAAAQLFGDQPLQAKRTDVLELNGEVGGYIGADEAEALLALVAIDGKSAYVLLFASDKGLEIGTPQCWDETRPISEVRCKAVKVPLGRVVCVGEDAAELKRKLDMQVWFAIAADSVGGAERILARTLDYMNTRKQFDRPISSFQALKHRCADHRMSLDAVAALLRFVAADTQSPDDAHINAAAAKVFAAQTYVALAEDAIQLHGGIGFTWEHDAHLYLKRARFNELAGGSTDQLQDIVAAHLLD